MATFCDKHNGVSDVLSLSYRLPVTVHAASQELIRKVTRRVDKEFSSRGHEGLLRVHGSINSVKIDPREDTLLLGRTHSVLRDFEQSIVEQRIPYTRTSGRPGLYQNRYASAVRVFRKICAGSTITEAERTALFTVATTQGKKIIESGDFKKLTGSPFYAHLNIPARWVEFYREADLDTKPSLRLSTIHGSKGGQAHRVILLTDMTQRVAENCDKNPDDEHRVFYVGMTRAMNTLDIVEGYNGFKVIGG
ncbi:MAG TPA: 3'-5' exonuclease [Fimbriimonas sp.]|nr:3'-5' exonuclease [Fimbriimonas sp.]